MHVRLFLCSALILTMPRVDMQNYVAYGTVIFSRNSRPDPGVVSSTWRACLCRTARPSVPSIADKCSAVVITPIPKIATPALPSDFRPISITPVLSRLLEKFVFRESIYPALLQRPSRSTSATNSRSGYLVRRPLLSWRCYIPCVLCWQTTTSSTSFRSTFRRRLIRSDTRR